MIQKIAGVFAMYALLVSAPAVLAQGSAQPQKPPAKSAKAPATPNEQNLKEYIQLLRGDVRSQKTAVMDAVMQLNLEQAAKFWPIYRDYDAALTTLNDQRVANIQEYAKDYDQLTDAQADELVNKALSYQKQRNELLAKYYDRVKQELGAVTAARFLQVEYQLLLIIDLQIASSLPIAGS
ncbi:MAG TPA: hypothetical protein VJX29_13035 [Candidatus Acidoferrales bacterium]|nr:hypothetical protein [Candidatus Acidoferrales bacterium]